MPINSNPHVLYEITDAAAEPSIPKRGTKRKLKIILVMVEADNTAKLTFCLPVAINKG